MVLKFPTTTIEAKKFQEEIIEDIILSDSFLKSNIVGAFDIAYKEDTAFAAGVIYNRVTETVIEEQTIHDRVEFPYIPGYLFLREVPHFLTLLDKINNIPDVMIIDGHGIAHPRSAGSATIFGILTDIPSIGVAKKPMKHFNYNRTSIDNLNRIVLNQKQVGFRHSFEKKWNPIYISPGHKISLDSAYKIVEGLLTSRYKLPIPQQLAHLLADKYKKSITGNLF